MVNDCVGCAAIRPAITGFVSVQWMTLRWLSASSGTSTGTATIINELRRSCERAHQEGKKQFRMPLRRVTRRGASNSGGAISSSAVPHIATNRQRDRLDGKPGLIRIAP
jgi:hypothetical protein